MKEAMGELNMTVVVIVAIGAVAAFFTLVLWPQIKENIMGNWDKIGGNDYDEKGDFNGVNKIVVPGFDIPNIYE